MREIVVKYHKIFMILLTVFAVCFFSACDSCSRYKDEESTEVLYLSESKIYIERYEKGIISPLDENVVVEWSSSNTEIVSIDENGCYLARKEGAVIITAKSNNKIGTCKITVTNNGFRPLIKTGLIDENITLINGGDFEFKPYISYNGKDYYDAQFNCVDANNIIKYENDKLVALKEGESYLSVTATWHEFEGNLKTEIPIKVVTSAFISVDKREINIETSDLKGGFVSDRIETTFFENNQKQTTGISWEFLEGEENVSVADNTFTAVKEGTAKVVAKTTASGGEVISSPIIHINVKLTTVETGEELVVEYPQNTLSLQLPDNSSLKQIYQSEKEIAYDKASGKIKGIDMGEQKWTMYASDVSGRNIAYVYDVIVARIIRTADEFVNIYSDLGNNPSANNGYSYSGYFMLANNIDCEGKVVSPNVVKVYSSTEDDRYDIRRQGFLGTLNGNGYTISNLTAKVGSYSYGIFGTIGETGVVKNIAFVNVKGGYNSVDHNYGALAANMSGTIENVYVHTEENFRAAFKVMVRGSTIKNFVVNGNFFKDSRGLSQQLESNLGVTYGCNIENCYTFTNTTQVVSGYLQFNLESYKTDERFVAINFEETLTERYWRVKDGEIPTFSSMSNEFKTEFYQSGSENLVVDLSFVPKGKTVTGIKLNGVTFSQNDFIVNDGKLTIKRAKVQDIGIPYGEHDMVVLCGQKEYLGTITVITKVINTAEEFADIYLGYGNNPTVDNGYQYGGYYVLGRNIDATGITMSPQVKEILGGAYDNSRSDKISTWGFVGTIDGRGYTIKNLTVGQYGVFGSVGDKGVIKNIAFTDIKGQISTYAFAGNFGGTLENVYISTSSKFRAITKYTSRNAKFKTVLIEVFSDVALIQSPDKDSDHKYSGTYKNLIMVAPDTIDETYIKWTQFSSDYKTDDEFINYDWSTFNEKTWIVKDRALPTFRSADDTESNGVKWDEKWN